MFTEASFTVAKKETQRKRDQICGYQSGVRGEGELHEVSQKVQTSSHKVNKYQGCNSQYDKYY